MWNNYQYKPASNLVTAKQRKNIICSKASKTIQNNPDFGNNIQINFREKPLRATKSSHHWLGSFWQPRNAKPSSHHATPKKRVHHTRSTHWSTWISLKRLKIYRYSLKRFCKTNWTLKNKQSPQKNQNPAVKIQNQLQRTAWPPSICPANLQKKLGFSFFV